MKPEKNAKITIFGEISLELFRLPISNLYFVTPRTTIGGFVEICIILIHKRLWQNVSNNLMSTFLKLQNVFLPKTIQT